MKFQHPLYFSPLKCGLIVLVSFVFTACATEMFVPSKVDVQNVNNLSNATANTLIYALPATVVRIEVEAEKIIKRAGPFYRYSQKMLNVSNVVMADKEEWSLKGVNVYTIGLPDENKRFKISFTGDNVAPLLNLTQEGILAGINLEEHSKTCSSLQSNVTEDVPSLSDVNFDAVPMLEKQLIKTSTAAMAQETANLIYKIRNRRFKILASNYPVLPPDGKSYEVTVRELNKLEEDFMELFVGKKESYMVTKTFDFIPDSTIKDNNVLCRFSTQEGILDWMDLSGTPIYIEFDVEELKTLPDKPEIISGKVQLKQGLYYCSPAKGSVKIIDRNVLLLEKEILLGQFGQLLSLPANLLEKNNVRIMLDPATGALMSISKE